MNSEFIKVLNERGILSENTKILAHYKGYTLDGSKIDTKGELLIKKIDFDKFNLEATPLFGHTRYLINMDDVLEIDGMDPKRLGKVFNINYDGSSQATGKKRGRKPKIRTEV
jgi:hypothetical protein